MELQVHGLKVGDIVRRRGTKPLWKITKIFTWRGEVVDLAALEPVRKDGGRHRGRTPISGPLAGYEKADTL
jgi:hypothetical protein